MVEEPLLINSEGEARATFHQGVQGLVHCQVANESFLAVSHATRFSPNQYKTVSKPFFEIKMGLFIFSYIKQPATIVYFTVIFHSWLF